MTNPNNEMEYEMLVPQDGEEIDPDDDDDMANMRAMLHHFNGDHKLSK
jgi:hypothetical protein